MRRRYQRLVDSLAAEGIDDAALSGEYLPPELSARQYALALLNVAAQIEHALMVQYLFAAYSLGGPQIDSPECRRLADEWRAVLLGIAKEEMGHLLTVQNIIRFLGGAPCLERDDYPVHSPFHAFEFRLEPLTRTSLACYIVAESPDKGVDPEIVREARKGNLGQPVNRVGTLYEMLVKLFRSEGAHAFAPPAPQPSLVRYQATWDEWGRGYRDGQRGRAATRLRGDVQSEQRPKDGPDLLILQVCSVEQAIDAIQTIAEQGESPHDISSGKSHYTRLLLIREAFPRDEWRPSRRTARNPSTCQWIPTETDVTVATRSDDVRTPATPPIARSQPPVNFIEHRVSRLWAHLFNVRYRMTLFGITHALQLPHTRAPARGQVIARVFGEMYNMRAIADVLVDLPLSEDPEERRKAGPPFEMPYSLTLPDKEPARWLGYVDFIDASRALISRLLDETTPHDQYLRALEHGDALYLDMVRRFMVQA
jgi:hypothetical protein